MADNRRLIDANTLYDELSTLSVCVTGIRAGKGVLKEFMEQYRESVLRIVDEQATVNAVEVVHGRWEDAYNGKYANPRYRCSVCKEKALYKHERDLLGNHKDVQALTTFCPYCMAKLDGGKANDI